eukprot:CAMPEP_0185042200 /NCGR_PEP_ID=MMETSP1103-20130426/42210_1 /TAXON_ID=36769 /ORGANISM="Paraphysomonas bandaiensis, Strain Caron Lab Isolate" /LENGTH=158 /DNA_ID=CAMNT_0027582227 /DNA_START=55 /DNA_END=531 /DNA_ORIENTATION=-
MTSQAPLKHNWFTPRTNPKGQMVKHRASRKVVFVVDSMPKYKSMRSFTSQSETRKYRKRSVSSLAEDWKQRKRNSRFAKRRKDPRNQQVRSKIRPSAPHNTSSVIMDMHNTPRHSLDQAVLSSTNEAPNYSDLNFYGSFLPQLTNEDYGELFNDDGTL